MPSQRFTLHNRFPYNTIIVCAINAGVCFGQTNVLTWHNDNARTGQNLSETVLSPANVKTATFGKLFSVAVDGKVDAQALYVSALSIAGQGAQNVVFAATENDSVYAFNADRGTIYWQVSLLGSGETASDDRGCDQVTPEIGITGTPVIDLTAGPHGTIYLVAMSRNAAGTYFQRLHALDITTGAEIKGSPILVQPQYSGTGEVAWNPSQYKARPGLLLINGTVYTSWGSHCDNTPYTGWTVGFNASTLQQSNVFNFAPNGSEAGIWASGGGPAADANGNLFFSVANGTFDETLNSAGFPNKGDFGNAFVKLSLQSGVLAAADYWTMYNSDSESAGDVDLGSGGIMLLPDMTDSTGKVRHLAVGAGKDSNLYMVDRDNMGKYDPAGDATIYQQLTGALPGGIWGNPAYYNGYVYFGAVGDHIRAFQLESARLSTTPVSTTVNTSAYPGITPSISANGTSNAILWAVENSTPAVLHAFDPIDLTTEFYNSNQAPAGRDQFGAGNKFIVPTIANGKVFVGTQNSVAVFGLLVTQVTVPNVVGLTQAAAKTTITSAGLVLGSVTTQSSSTVAAGDVVSESPVAGTSVNSGSAVNLVESSGPASLGPPSVVSLAPSSGSGSAQTFTGVYADPNGTADFATVRMLFNTSVDIANACYVLYYRATNTLYLENDGGTGLSTAVTPGSSAQVSNSQCALAGAGSSVTLAGDDLTLQAALTFSGTLTAPMNVYLIATENNFSNSGWVQKGTWGASLGPPSVVSLTPRSGLGMTQTFAGLYSDPNGTGDLATVRMLFNSSIKTAGACYVLYYRATNALYLENDAGNGLSAGVTPGSSGQISNSQCTLTANGSSVSFAGDDLTLSVALTFSSTFVTPVNVYLLATENSFPRVSTAYSGWVLSGTWTP